jgi:hypothetical protein
MQHGLCQEGLRPRSHAGWYSAVLHVQQAQHGVEQVVVRRGLGQRGARRQARSTAARCGEAGRQPHHHRHLLLQVGRDGVGQAVQEQVVLAQRLAVVGDVEQRAVERAGAGLQLRSAGQHVVGVQQRVVVGVDDLSRLQLRRSSLRHSGLKRAKAAG